MTRGWWPGDVAMLTWSDEAPTIGIRISGCPMPNHPGADHWHTGAGRYGEHPDDARPLVVIDPEDREQVERLWLIVPNYTGTTVDQLQGALRRFADPKPAEPTGLGAVVEDADGRRFVRTCTDPCAADGPACQPWEQVGKSGSQGYDVYADIAAVKVLSEGVQG